MDICPEVFKLGDDDIAQVIVDEVSDDLIDKVQEAIDECPMEIISWEE